MCRICLWVFGLIIGLLCRVCDMVGCDILVRWVMFREVVLFWMVIVGYGGNDDLYDVMCDWFWFVLVVC